MLRVYHSVGFTEKVPPMPSDFQQSILCSKKRGKVVELVKPSKELTA
jgi:hypothetical protein